MTNEVFGFDGLNYLFILVILSKLMIKCVNRVWYVCESFRGPMEMVERDHYF